MGNGTAEGSGVGERFVEIVGILDFFAFEDRAAIEAFDVLRIVVFGDEALAFVGAGWFSHCRKPFLEFPHYNIAAASVRRSGSRSIFDLPAIRKQSHRSGKAASHTLVEAFGGSLWVCDD